MYLVFQVFNISNRNFKALEMVFKIMLKRVEFPKISTTSLLEVLSYLILSVFSEIYT